MDRGEKQQQLSLSKSSRHHRCSEWIFRDVPSDITLEVSGITFALHKFPLVSRSGRIRRVVAEHRDAEVSRVELLGLPGGAEALELAAKFCYSINFEITAANVAALVCVSDYLEMTEDYSKGNLGSRAEEYLESVVCKSLELSVEVLRRCESLLPLADELRVVPRCVDAVAARACAEQIASSFSRLEYSSSGRLHMARGAAAAAKSGDDGGDWWIEDLSALRVDLYARVISAMKCRGVRPESVGASLVSYAQKELAKKPVPAADHHERAVVETIVGLLPAERQAVPMSFLFGLLRAAEGSGARAELERRIGSQLDAATLDDLLIPSFRHAGDTLFDVDVVHRILVNFSQLEDSDDDDDGAGAGAGEDDDGSVLESEDSPRSPTQSALLKVGKLVDNYLAEIAPDSNLKLAKFIAIADALPAHARTVHDGLYRAVDIYLKAHQNLTEAERKKVSKLVDFQKLTEEGGAHAAQNERLPLQSIVQVLYFEQIRLRNSLCSGEEEGGGGGGASVVGVGKASWRSGSGAVSPRDNYASLRRENRELKLELARLRMRLNDLEREHVCMKKDMERSNSTKFVSSFSKKIGHKLRLFAHRHTSSRGSTSPSKHSYRTDSKLIHRTCASTD